MAWLERFWFSCGHCHGPDTCPLVQAEKTASEDGRSEMLQGSQLVLTTLTVFILPLMVAIAGAYFAGRYVIHQYDLHGWGLTTTVLGRWQATGLIGGLIVGVALAKLVVPWIGRERSVSPMDTQLKKEHLDRNAS